MPMLKPLNQNDFKLFRKGLSDRMVLIGDEMLKLHHAIKDSQVTANDELRDKLREKADEVQEISETIEKITNWIEANGNNELRYELLETRFKVRKISNLIPQRESVADYERQAEG